MLAHQMQTNTGRFISFNDLQAIQWVNTTSPCGLSDREMDLFHVLGSAIRMNPGRNWIRCTVAELARVHVSCHVRSKCSPSTVRRALAGLESKGYLARRRCRVGDASRGLDIILCLDKWSFWTKHTVGNVTPISSREKPTSVYISPRQSILLDEDRTRTTHSVNTRNSRVNNRNNTHKGEHKKIYKYHPIVFTLWCVLTKAKAPDRRNLLNRAEIELKAASAGVELRNHTGVPWEQYSRQWRDMLPPVRESFARSQILPKLRGAVEVTGFNPVSPPDPPPGEVPQEVATPAEIRELIEQSMKSPPPPAAPKPPPSPPAEMSLDSRELLILERARRVAGGRGVDNG